MICDFHAHLFHPRWYPLAFQQAMFRDFHRRQRRPSGDVDAVNRNLARLLTDDTGEATLRVMDRVGIEKRVILILDWGPELGEADRTIGEIHRDVLGICQAHSDRFIGFAGIDPRRTDAREIITWAFDELGARGLKLHPTGGWKLTDPATLDVVAIAASRKSPVLVHLGKTIDTLSDRNAQPEPFLALASQFPEIAFVAGHSAFDRWRTFLAQPVPSNIYFDISGWQERAGPEVDTDLLALQEAFPGRVCFGTDSPFYSFNLPTAEKQWLDRTRNRNGPWATVPGVLP